MSINIKLGKVKDFMSHDQKTNMVKVIYIIKGQYIGTHYQLQLHKQKLWKHFVKKLNNNVLNFISDLA